MENWNLCFVPECYFDTILFKRVLQTGRRLKHTKGCYNVVNRFRIIGAKKGDMYDSPFGVGMVDKDKTDLEYLHECEIVKDLDMLKLWKNKVKLHFIIQINPPLEKWVLRILTESGLKIEDFHYSPDPKTLKKQIKDDIDDENNEKLNRLVNTIINLDHAVIQKLKSMLLYLRDKNVNTDVEELKQELSN